MNPTNGQPYRVGVSVDRRHNLHGDFAAGERRQPASAAMPDFARGERTQPGSGVTGDFAQGEHLRAPNPVVGDFASGSAELPSEPNGPVQGPTPWLPPGKR
jgi:hypothetical protein